MLDLETIAPEAPVETQQATPEPEIQQQQEVDHGSEPEIQSSDAPEEGDFLSRLADKIDAAEKGGETEIVESGEGDKPESAEESDELETPEMTAAVKKMSMKSAEAFNKVKANANAKIAELKAKLQAVESKAQSSANDSKIEELSAAIQAKETALAEATKKLAFHDVTETPEYEQAVKQPTQIIKSKIAHIAEKYELNEQDLIKAITEKSPKIQGELQTELSAGMADPDKYKFYQIFEDWEAIVTKEATLRENAIKAWEEVSAKRQSEQEAQRSQMTQERVKLGNDVWEKLTSKVPLIKDLEPDKLKAQFDSTDFDAMKPIDKVGALAAAVSFVPLVRKFMDQVATKDAKIKELETAMKKYVRSSPGAGSGTSTQVKPVAEDGLGFLEAIERRMGGG